MTAKRLSEIEQAFREGKTGHREFRELLEAVRRLRAMPYFFVANENAVSQAKTLGEAFDQNQNRS